MIITLTLNPAVDKTVEINDFKVNHVNRVSSIRLDCGGKGINVSKVIRVLEGESKAIGILAGESGRFIKGQLDNLKIENDFVFVEGETRTNIKIVDRINNTNTDVNEKGPNISEQDLDQVRSKILESLNENSVLVLSGSVPSNVNNNVYKYLIIEAKKKGVKTFLDADGELLRQGIEAGPFLVKPNIHELERLYNKKIISMDEAIKTAKKIFAYGVEVVVISLGGEGSILLTKERTIMVKGIEVEVISTVGAGDAMVAALALAVEKEYSLENAMILATAASAASVMTSGTGPGELHRIKDLEKKVKLHDITNQRVVK